MKKKLLYSCLAVTLGTGAGYAASVLAQAKPETLVKQRQAAMTLQSKYFGPLAGMAKGKIPYNAEAAVRNAAYLEVLSNMAWDGFHPSTKDTTAKTRALPAIYENEAKFKEAQDQFRSAATKLAAAAKDESALKGAVGEVAKICSSCHNDFRAK